MEIFFPAGLFILFLWRRGAWVPSDAPTFVFYFKQHILLPKIILEPVFQIMHFLPCSMYRQPGGAPVLHRSLTSNLFRKDTTAEAAGWHHLNKPSLSLVSCRMWCDCSEKRVRASSYFRVKISYELHLLVRREWESPISSQLFTPCLFTSPKELWSLKILRCWHALFRKSLSCFPGYLNDTTEKRHKWQLTLYGPQETSSISALQPFPWRTATRKYTTVNGKRIQTYMCL